MADANRRPRIVVVGGEKHSWPAVKKNLAAHGINAEWFFNEENEGNVYGIPSNAEFALILTDSLSHSFEKKARGLAADVDVPVLRGARKYGDLRRVLEGAGFPRLWELEPEVQAARQTVQRPPAVSVAGRAEGPTGHRRWLVLCVDSQTRMPSFHDRGDADYYAEWASTQGHGPGVPACPAPEHAVTPFDSPFPFTSCIPEWAVPRQQPALGGPSEPAFEERPEPPPDIVDAPVPVTPARGPTRRKKYDPREVESHIVDLVMPVPDGVVVRVSELAPFVGLPEPFVRRVLKDLGYEFAYTPKRTGRIGLVRGGQGVATGRGGWPLVWDFRQARPVARRVNPALL